MRAVGTVVLLLLAGCVSVPSPAPNRLLPWNWFHSDATARLEKAELKNLRAEWASIHAALIEARKAQVVLASAPKSPEVDLAIRFVGNATGLMNQVTPLTAAEDSSLRSIVTGFLSFNPDLVAEAEKRQLKLEAEIGRLSDNIVATAAREQALKDELKVANTANAADASKYRRIWFWIWTAIAVYVFIQVLPVISKLFPAFAPIAKAASWIAAPAVQAGYSRLREAVGETIHAAKQAGSISIEKLREKIDGPIDLAEQKELHQQFEKVAAKDA